MGVLKKVYSRVDEIGTVNPVEYVGEIQEYRGALNLGSFTNDDQIPNLRAVKAIAGSPAQQVVNVTSANFTYPSGITAYNPKAQTYLKVGNTYEPYGTAIWDQSTGDITTTVYNGVDDFWLFV